MNIYALASIVFVFTVLLVALVLVLQHLVAMRASDSEVAELRKQWKEGSTAIALAEAALDKKVDDLTTQLTHLKNRLPQLR